MLYIWKGLLMVYTAEAIAASPTIIMMTDYSTKVFVAEQMQPDQVRHINFSIDLGKYLIRQLTSL